MFRQFDEDARRICVEANEESFTRMDGYLGTHHVLLAMTKDKVSVAGKILSRLGATYERCCRVLSAHPDWTDSVPSGVPARYREFLQRARSRAQFRAACRGSRSLVTPNDLLFALLQDRESLAVRMLRALEVKRDDVGETVFLSSLVPYLVKFLGV